MSDISIRKARKEEASMIAELFMLAWPVGEILESNGITYEQLHESMTEVAASEQTIYSYENTYVAEALDRSSSQPRSNAQDPLVTRSSD